MTNEPRQTGDVEQHTRHSKGDRPVPRGLGHGFKVFAISVASVAIVCVLLVGAGFGVLYNFNPVGDEWVCSKGQAPAGAGPRGNDCYPEGSTLPEGVSWDRFGNRPMSYNCNKEGWVLIRRSVTRDGVTVNERDCVREGTELAGRWQVVHRG